ncbi:GNAT family N-acetyltransferase [Kitasatospora sp. NPDC096147]|uniref:GNAT family N-acetyltransferase n=1 Tax=Kitasatospora sp. NPDC096147 TaxID=3364093 RepID=UPI003806F523
MAPVEFAQGSEVTVVVSPRSLFCPPGWVGLVALGDAAIVTAPDAGIADSVREALAGLPTRAITDPGVIRRVLPEVGRVLGPAILAYLAEADFRPAAGRAGESARAAGMASAAPQAASAEPAVEQVPADDRGLPELERLAGPEDAGEAGLDGITSPAFVVREGGRVVAAAGYRIWPGGTAHISVLTAPERRGRGLARRAGSHAVADALAGGLFPQWRARVPASRRVALALGFRELGTQLSVEVGGRPDREPSP